MGILSSGEGTVRIADLTIGKGTSTVRVAQDENGEPWFIAKDVCLVLGLNNITEALRGLDEDEKADFSTPEVRSDGLTQRRNLIIINESGLYSLILRSKKLEAKRFKKWVTSEVLPAIRKHGAYGRCGPTRIQARDRPVMSCWATLIT